MWTLSLIFRGLLTVADCKCLIPDENDCCINCGKPIELPVVTETPNLGDIPGICKLIDVTAAAYVKLVQDNTDPANPTLPRLRMIGGQIIRIPHETLYKNLIEPSYQAARKLGYLG